MNLNIESRKGYGMRTALKVAYIVYIVVAIAITAWVFASWLDVVVNSLHQPWNFFDIIVEAFAR